MLSDPQSCMSNARSPYLKRNREKEVCIPWPWGHGRQGVFNLCSQSTRHCSWDTDQKKFWSLSINPFTIFHSQRLSTVINLYRVWSIGIKVRTKFRPNQDSNVLVLARRRRHKLPRVSSTFRSAKLVGWESDYQACNLSEWKLMWEVRPRREINHLPSGSVPRVRET